MSKYSNEELAGVFQALSNPNRLAIYRRLMTCCEAGQACTNDDIGRICVGDLGENLPMVASTLSHHVKALSQAGLIFTERRGQHVECWLNDGMRDLVKEFFSLAPVTVPVSSDGECCGPETSR